MKQTFSFVSAMALVAGLAACAQVGGGSVMPASPGGRDPMTLRAIPIETPVPTPTPSADDVPTPSPTASPKPPHRRP